MNTKDVTTSSEDSANDKTLFGFWVYLLTDLLMFAVLFATYAVLQKNTYGGEGSEKLFSLPLALAETLILLTSSFTCGIGMIYARSKDKQKTLFFFGLTFLLGVLFLGLEFSEFSKLASEGNIPQKSAFLSAFFTLVGTHGLHIISGLFWLGILLFYIMKKGVNESALRKLTLLSIFWHLLDVVWIFIFTIVYLMGAL
jgi:cytochrome o ubiquinol oxidase subunit 3